MKQNIENITNLVLFAYKESLLGDPGRPVVVVPPDGDERVAHLQSPGVHDILYVDVGVQGAVLVSLGSEVAPQVVLLRSLVGQGGQVVGESLDSGQL